VSVLLAACDAFFGDFLLVCLGVVVVEHGHFGVHVDVAGLDDFGDLLGLDDFDGFERVQVLKVDVEVDARTHELLRVFVKPVLAHDHLDVVGHDAALLLPGTDVPEDD